MKYKLFSGDFFYPSGGYGDFIGSFETVQECIDFVEKTPLNFEWSHIVEEDRIILEATKQNWPKEMERIWVKNE